MEDKITELENRISDLEKEINDYKKIGAARDISLFQFLGWDKNSINEYLSILKQETTRLGVS